MFQRPSDRSKTIAKARQQVRTAMASPDLIIVQTVASIDEVTKVANLLSERLTEWYGLHFPEFKSNDPKKFAAVAAALDRASPDEAALSAIIGNPDSAKAILQKASASMGVAFSKEDFAAVRALANEVLSMNKLREELEGYQEAIATRICPNMSHIAGPALAAKLVAQSGSLAKLATFPASTIQVLGAEKALFKHLKTGSKPPKHGVIFQHPLISTSPKKLRGKIARALAGKLCIAAKADATTHNFIAPALKEQFERRANSILAAGAAGKIKSGE